jgi:hypothetical protein
MSIKEENRKEKKRKPNLYGRNSPPRKSRASERDSIQEDENIDEYHSKHQRKN